MVALSVRHFSVALADWPAGDVRELRRLMIILSHSLRSAPPTHWGADRASREAGEALLRDVNRYRRQRQPRAAEVVLMDGCGAGEMPVNIQTRPAGGQVTYIPLFRFRLCEARGLAPQDPRACRGWVNVSKPEEFLSGLYAYVVRWPDGQLSSGVFDTEKARINDRSGSDVAHVLLTR